MKTYETFVSDLFKKKDKLDEPGKFFRTHEVVRRKKDGKIGLVDMTWLSVHDQKEGKLKGYYNVVFDEETYDAHGERRFKKKYYKKDLDKLNFDTRKTQNWRFYN